MIRFLTAAQLAQMPVLQDTMFRDRADQFKTRLGWDVRVDAQGWERDEYDDMNPLYVLCQGADGRHLGSMRFLPSSGRTMIRDHFQGMLGAQDIRSPDIWECTRFCLARDAGAGVAGRLMSAGGEVLNGFGLTGFAGIFDARMVRIYKRIGSSPDILAAVGEGRERISIGIWRFSDDARVRVARRSGMTQAAVHHLFRMRFGDAPRSPFLPAEWPVAAE